MSRRQQLGERMAAEYGFLGVPAETFDEGGRRQFIALLKEGLSPEDNLCEIGAGCLRTACWLIPFLDAGGYCGIEPHRGRVAWGLEALIAPDLRAEKTPRFDFNDGFDTSVFGERFDFFLAGSIWTHAAKHHIETMLDGFLRDAAPGATYLASWLAPRTPEEDYLGDTWVGTSHESDVAGVIRHDFRWIEEQCARRGLSVEKVPGPAFDGQTWLRVRHAGAPPRAEKIEG